MTCAHVGEKKYFLGEKGAYLPLKCIYFKFRLLMASSRQPRGSMGGVALWREEQKRGREGIKVSLSKRNHLHLIPIAYISYSP
jgi:hypothetical protein